MIPRRLAGSFIAATLLIACGGSATNSGGEGGQGGDASLTNKEDHDVLATCSQEGCDLATAQRIEGGSEFAMYGMGCVVTALRDRTPGRYQVELDHSWGNGSETLTYTYVVLDSGEVEVGVHEKAVVESDSQESWRPTATCTLKDATFFEDCLAAIELGDAAEATSEAWACVFPDIGDDPPWLVSCTEAAPTCE
jgi:hypothetical protein